MATKQETINLVDIFKEFNQDKSIGTQTLITVLEDSFKSVISKMYGPSADYTIIVNPDKGDLEIYRNRLVMEDGDVANPDTQISLSDARLLDEEAEVGDDVTDQVSLASFGRRMILNLRQTLASKIMELQKEALYQKYKDMLGQVVTGELYQVWKKEMLLLDEEGNELYLPKQNQIPTDFYRKGDMVRAVVIQVENKNQQPKIILSRTAPLFLQRLFEQEVPEVKEGLIAIKKIARIPGERAKVAVETFDERIDPVGACVGVKGARIHGIVRELRNENIDVINYTPNVNLYIQRALAPAKISSMEIDEESKTAKVYLKPDEVSLAIGKGGYNVKLAGMLTGYEVEVYREIDEDLDDIYLDELNDEIDQWVIDAFKAAGFDTAKEVLETGKEDLIKRTDLEEETIDDVCRILAAEFAND